MDNDTMRGLAIGLIAGALIGAGLGILYAPQSGRKTRRDIQRQAQEIKGKAEEFGETVKKRAEEISDTVSDNAEKYRRKVMEAVKEFT
jgi:gas vesicle protein